MTRQAINRGTNPGDGTGDTAFVGAGKINANFTELFKANVLNVTSAPYYGSGSSATTTTTGANGAGTTINVADGSSFSANQGVYITGAGAAGAAYVGTVA